MGKPPNLLDVRNIPGHCAGCEAGITMPDGSVKYVPARPINGYGFSDRFRLAWMVFTGRADALVWPYQ